MKDDRIKAKSKDQMKLELLCDWYGIELDED